MSRHSEAPSSPRHPRPRRGAREEDAGEAAPLQDQAVRPRHQRADARSHEPVPVRGARRVPADADARGAGRPQEGHLGGRAQRAPGEPVPRRDREQGERPDPGRHRARAARRGHRDRPALPPDRGDEREPAGEPRDAQGRQQDPRRRHRARRAPPRARGDPRLQGHQHAHQGACPWARGRGLFQRQGARGHRRPLHRGARARGRFLGPPRQGHGVVEEGRAHLLPDPRPALPGADAERVRVPGGRPPAARARQGGLGPDGGAGDGPRLHAREERGVGDHGAQPRAELRAQPADEPGHRFRHACSGRRGPARPSSRSPPG